MDDGLTVGGRFFPTQVLAFAGVNIIGSPSSRRNWNSFIGRQGHLGRVSHPVVGTASAAADDDVDEDDDDEECSTVAIG